MIALLADSAEAHKSGPIGIVVIVALAIACYFLFRSMSMHLRRVRENFPQNPAEPVAAPPKPEPPA